MSKTLALFVSAFFLATGAGADPCLECHSKITPYGMDGARWSGI